MKMKNLSLFLGVLLLFLMYYTPQELKNVANTSMGKLVLVVLLAYLALTCDNACSIIFAVIIIVLLHETKEGFGAGGGFADLLSKTTENADKMEKKKAQAKKEGFKEGNPEGKKKNNREGKKKNNGKGKKKNNGEGKKNKKDGAEPSDEEKERVIKDAQGEGKNPPSNPGSDTENEDEGEDFSDRKKEGFVGLDDMKNVSNKLQTILGFSRTDLDRFMKTSSEKNTMASTKDLYQ